MELVQSYHQLNSFISEIRSLRKGFISNLFLHFEKHNWWIEKKELFYQAQGLCRIALQQAKQPESQPHWQLKKIPMYAI